MTQVPSNSNLACIILITILSSTCQVLSTFGLHQLASVIEEMSRFHSVLEPRLMFLIHYFDRIQDAGSCKEVAIEKTEQSAVAWNIVVGPSFHHGSGFL